MSVTWLSRRYTAYPAPIAAKLIGCVNYFPSRNAAGYFTDYQGYRDHQHHLGADQGDGFSNCKQLRPAAAVRPEAPCLSDTGADRRAVSLDEFGEQARMGYRNASVHKIAVEVAEGRLDIESWNDRSITTEDLYKRLLSLPGIGPYAASCLLIYLGKYDRVNADSWARTLVGKELGRKVTDKEVHQFFAPHGKWQALAYHFYRWKPDDPL